MANYEEIRRKAEEERLHQEKLDSLGVPQTGTTRSGEKCELCQGQTIEEFIRWRNDKVQWKLDNNQWITDGGEWRLIHDLTNCVRNLSARIAQLEHRAQSV